MAGLRSRIFTPPMSVLAGVMLLASAIVPPAALPSETLCLLRRMTGFLCPLCGITHSVCSIGHGMFFAAWEYNPLGYIAYGAAILFAIAWPILTCFPPLDTWLVENRFLRLATASCLTLFCGFGMWRVLMQVL